MNTLYFGDNLDVLRRYVASDSVDLVYLDPPFNSTANYNVLFSSKDGSDSAAQIEAFTDTWKWDRSAAAAFDDVVCGDVDGVCDLPTSRSLQGFRAMIGECDLLAYLAFMAPRLLQLRRVLTPTGSIYLHCDPSASHYLKVLMDAVFGVESFRAEIMWKRTSAHSDTKQGMKQPGRIHDTILFYTAGTKWTWNPVYTPYDERYARERFSKADSDGRLYKDADATAAKPGGDTSYEWRVKREGAGPWTADLEKEYEVPVTGWEYAGVLPSAGRYWAYSYENMVAMARADDLYHTSKGTPRLKQYADTMPGIPLQDIWTDIPPLNSQAAERLGYPTQKPEALLDRIIEASSNPGDVVLDPFCGCGTAVASAQRLGRKWIGIDVTHLAISLIRKRLQDQYGAGARFEVVGEPTSADGAAELAELDRFQFQAWALDLVGARTATSAKKGADRGVDGRLFFRDDAPGKAGGKTRQVIFSVKSGKNVSAPDVRDLKGVVDREKADLGVLITLTDPTSAMRKEAASSGHYDSPTWNRRYPKIQILTISELLDGRTVDMPAVRQSNETFRSAPRSGRVSEQGSLEL